MRLPVERGIWVFLVLVLTRSAPVLTNSFGQSRAVPSCPLVNFLTTQTWAGSIVATLPAGLLFSCIRFGCLNNNNKKKKMIINNKRKGQQISSDFISAPATPCDYTSLRDGQLRLRIRIRRERKKYRRGTCSIVCVCCCVCSNKASLQCNDF